MRAFPWLLRGRRGDRGGPRVRALIATSRCRDRRALTNPLRVVRRTRQEVSMSCGSTDCVDEISKLSSLCRTSSSSSSSSSSSTGIAPLPTPTTTDTPPLYLTFLVEGILMREKSVSAGKGAGRRRDVPRRVDRTCGSRRPIVHDPPVPDLFPPFMIHHPWPIHLLRLP